MHFPIIEAFAGCVIKNLFSSVHREAEGGQVAEKPDSPSHLPAFGSERLITDNLESNRPAIATSVKPHVRMIVIRGPKASGATKTSVQRSAWQRRHPRLAQVGGNNTEGACTSTVTGTWFSAASCGVVGACATPARATPVPTLPASRCLQLRKGFPKQRGVCRLYQFSIDASSFKWRRSFRYMHGDPSVRRLVRNQVERASRRGFELRRRAAAKYHGTPCSS